jgi:hypothetical protein
MALKIQGTTVVDDNRNLTNIKEIQETATNVGTGSTINCNEGTVFYTTPNANVTYTFSNAPTVCTFSLRITPSASIAITWPTSVDWPGGTAPDAPASGETDWYVFSTVDGGTTWYGFQAGDALA